jgi:acetylornithine deacetylase
MSSDIGERAAALLQEFISIPSLALAAGEAPPDGRYGEARMAEALIAHFTRHGIAVQVDEVEPGRPQVTARLGSGRPELLLNAHLDTVPPVDWPADPFTPRWTGTRVSGLGACDDKASLVAMLLAFLAVAAEGGPETGTLTLIATVGEETFGVGSRALLAAGYRPDAAIVGEPTELKLIRVEGGNVRWRFHTRGRAAHGSRPWLGDSAIFRMADALRFLRDEISVECRALTHPLIGPAAFNVGVVNGGTAVNIVPDRCSATVERRVLPGEDALAEMESINHRLAELLGAEHVVFDPPLTVNQPVNTPEDNRLVRLFAAALEERGMDPVPGGVSFGSDANRFAASGASCVLFGPGSIRVAHTREEAVDLPEVTTAAEVLHRVARRFLSEHVPREV